nr:unnamed protein product [Callosobruchus analis]
MEQCVMCIKIIQVGLEQLQVMSHQRQSLNCFNALLTNLQGKGHVKVMLVQQLDDDDPDRRLQFCEWIQEMVIREPGFMGSIIWSDEAQFKLNGTVNRHTCVYWCEENPHITIEKAVNLPGVNVWCGLSSRGLIGPFRFEGTQRHRANGTVQARVDLDAMPIVTIGE